MKDIFITGTSRGIGYALAEKFLQMNFRVFGLSHSSNNSIEHPNYIHLTADLSQPGTPEQVIRKLSALTGHLHAVIHNAGTLIKKPFQDITPEDYRRIFQVNFFAVTEMTRLLLPLFQNDSHILTVSSVAGLENFSKIPGLSAYSATKGALINWTLACAAEYAGMGIRFNTVAPGGVQTRMFEQAFPGYQAALQPGQIAAEIAGIITEEDTYTGKIFPITG